MAITIIEIQDAFEYLYDSLCRKSFTKSLYLEHWGERNLLPLVRTYLLGYFGDKVTAEVEAKLPLTLSGKGRFDFRIDDVVIEFAVRTAHSSINTLSHKFNESEVKKLVKYKGKSLLVLFDFSSKPFSVEELNLFRELPSLGKGNHQKSPFKLSYFCKVKGQTQHIPMQIRIK